MSFIINEAAQASAPRIESANNNIVRFVTILQEADKKNRNGRIYPKHVLQEGIANPQLQEKLRTKNLFGECGHPLDQSVLRQMSIDQRNIAFIIDELWWDGDFLMGRCETADTAAGRDMKGLIEQGTQVAFSLRAQGNVHKDLGQGADVVDSPIMICSWDWVCLPSHDKAYLDHICEDTSRMMFRYAKTRPMATSLNESLDVYSNGLLTPIDDKALKNSVVEDYARYYGKPSIPQSMFYTPDSSDVVQNMSLNETVLINGGTVKKVFTEDYVMKDIRSRIAEFGKTPDELNEGEKIKKIRHDYYMSKAAKVSDKASNVQSKMDAELQKEITLALQFYAKEIASGQMTEDDAIKAYLTKKHGEEFVSKSYEKLQGKKGALDAKAAYDAKRAETIMPDAGASDAEKEKI
jgi:hypothetical protein